jgi:hypothetical protein
LADTVMKRLKHSPQDNNRATDALVVTTIMRFQGRKAAEP